ncbi:MAG: Transcriptional regulator, LysR family [uncultured Propionibacteriaceae bacterium]|uniref:Transcriptional regulator, LysR family n=1 Tax=uncultured Propionibacteriaceae bacterium TaxID=257457 RepID=A0A6J4NSI2_9ACTN|nr:MAG: Transcriptional regulator, LysR family [uncultured Propionibacteriaceae bacterium]
MELRQLEHFIAVAEEQHFTRAAELLHISQSGLSASVRALETELGTDLFLRSTRRVELTQAGQAFLDEAVRTVTSAAAARNAVQAVRGVLRGSISVGTEQCLGVVNLPKELAVFRIRHPEVEASLTFEGSSTLVDRLIAGQLDLGLIAVCGGNPRGVELAPLWSEGFVVLCHPDHPLAKHPIVELEQLAGQALVGFLPGWGARVLTEHAFATVGIKHRVAMEVNDVHTLLDLVGHNLGVAIVPEHFARKRPATLRAVPVDGDLLQWQVAAALPVKPSAAAVALLDQFVRSQQPTAAA